MGLGSFASGHIQDLILNLFCGSIYLLCFQTTSANCCLLRTGVASVPLWLGRDHVSTKNQPQKAEQKTGIQGRDQSGGEVGNTTCGEAWGWDAGGVCRNVEEDTNITQLYRWGNPSVQCAQSYMAGEG